MSTLKADTLQAKTTNGTLTLANNGTGKVELPADATIGGVALGADQVARDMAASAMTLILANTDANQNGAVGPFWLADDFESDNLTTKTNATYDAAGDYYSNIGTTTTSSAAAEWAGNTGEYTFPGDDIELTANDNSIYSIDEFTGDFDFQFTYKTDEADISIIGLFEASNKGSFNGAGSAQSFSGWYWNNHSTRDHLADYSTLESALTNNAYSMAAFVDGDIVTFGRSGTSIYVKRNGATVHTFATTSSATLALYIGQASGSTGHMLDVSWSVPGAPVSITLAPTAATITTANPTDILGYVVIDPQEAITVGTDIVMTASIDGGTTDATGSWTKVGDIGTTELYRVEFDVSAQTGSSLIYEITTANAKEIRYNASVGLVPLY